MRIYISGPISGKADFLQKFTEAENELKREYGAKTKIVNPAYMSKTIDSLEHRDQIELCFKLLDQCDVIYLIDGWEASTGAQAEYGYAVANKLLVIEQIHFRQHPPTLITPEYMHQEAAKAEKKYKVKCEVCGKEFETAYKQKKLCSEECKKIRIKQNKVERAQKIEKELFGEEKTMTNSTEKNKKSKIRPSRAFEIEAEARKVGKHYADIQKEKTLAMVRAQMEGK